MTEDPAHLCLLDALACAFQALQQPACTRLLGPVVPGATMPFGARVPGTSLQLDPVQAAFNFGAMIGWLDQRDAALARGDGHLSDTLGALLCVGDYCARKALAEAREPPKVRDFLSALLAADTRQAREVACAMSVASMLGGSPAQIDRARQLASGGQRPAMPDIACRPHWWLGDANARATRLALLALAEVDATVTPPMPEPTHTRPLPIVDAATAGRIRDRFAAAVVLHFPPAQGEKIKAVLTDLRRVEALPINELVSLTVRN